MKASTRPAPARKRCAPRSTFFAGLASDAAARARPLGPALGATTRCWSSCPACSPISRRAPVVARRHDPARSSPTAGPRPAGRHNTVHVNLDPLASEDTDELLRSLLPDADAELVSILRDRSGGNPFFIEELVAMLGEAPAAEGARELPGHAARAARRPPRPARPARPRHARGRRGDRQHRSARPGAGARGGPRTPTPTRRSTAPRAEGPARDRRRRVPVPQRAHPRRRLRHADQGRAGPSPRLADQAARRGSRSGPTASTRCSNGSRYHFNLAASLMAELGRDRRPAERHGARRASASSPAPRRRPSGATTGRPPRST